MRNTPRKQGALYQLVPIARRRDAVGRMALGMVEVARRLGFSTLLFTERQRSASLGRVSLGPLRQGLLEPSRPWAGEPAPRVALYHHSIGSAVAERFLEWDAQKKILLYHNITPPELFAAGSPGHRDARWGIEQLARLVKASHLQIGLSDFSCRQLQSMGARHVARLPYFLWKRNLSARPNVAPNKRAPLILVVGRVEPHKRVVEAVHAFAALKRRIPAAKLVIIGQCKANPSYAAAVSEAVHRLGLQADTRMTGRIPDALLTRFYGKAQALLTLSAHEGFCVPIAEAMRAGVPVVAADAGAVAETLGAGGILLSSTDPEEASAALARLLTEPGLRASIQKAQREELKRFEPERFEAKLAEALETLP